MRSVALGLLAGLLLSAPAGAAERPSAIERSTASVVTVLAGDAQGAAFAYAAPGRLLTNAHVIGHARTVELLTDGGRHARGRVIAVDRRHDLALIESGGLRLAPIPLRARPARLGETVYAVGAPLGLGGSVSRGIISATRPRLGGGLQTDAAVNPGNSGGPLLDRHGRVLGITTSRLDGTRGIAFAVPVARAATLHRGQGVSSLDAGTATPWLLWAAAALVAALACLTAALVLRRRHRQRDEVRLRRHRRAPSATTTNVALPVTAFEPEPSVRLKGPSTTDI
jgi:hypothetical protein